MHFFVKRWNDFKTDRSNGVTALGGLLALGGGNIFGGLRTGDAGGVASGFRAVID